MTEKQAERASWRANTIVVLILFACCCCSGFGEDDDDEDEDEDDKTGSNSLFNLFSRARMSLPLIDDDDDTD